MTQLYKNYKLPDSKSLMDTLKREEELKFSTAIKGDRIIKDIEENGVPDITGVLWNFFTILLEQLEDDFEDVAYFETDYLRKHTSGNSYDEQLDFYKGCYYPNAQKMLHITFLNKLILDFKNDQADAKEYVMALLMRYFPGYIKRLKKYRAMDFNTAANDGFIAIDGIEEGDYEFDCNQSISLLYVSCIIIGVPINVDLKGFVKLINDDYNETEGVYTDTDEDIEPYVPAIEDNGTDIVEEIKAHDPDIKEDDSEKINDLASIIESDFDSLDSNVYGKLITYYMNKFDYMDSYGIGFCFSDNEFLEQEVLCMQQAGIDTKQLSAMDLYHLIHFTRVLEDLLFAFGDGRRLARMLIFEGYDSNSKDKANLRLSSKPAASHMTKQEKRAEEKKDSTTESSTSDSEYVREIETLKTKLQNAEENIARQRELYEIQKEANRVLKEENKRISEMSNELKSLREFAHNCTDEDSYDNDIISRKDMIEKLNSYTCCVIGGHDNWVNKLKSLFPKWKFAAPQEQGSVPVNILNNADHVFIFTNHICHPQYNRFMDHIRKHNISMTYIAKVNIDDNIRAFYDAVVTHFEYPHHFPSHIRDRKTSKTEVLE